MQETKLHAEVLKNDCRGNGKQFIQSAIINRLQAIHNDITKDLPSKDIAILKNDIMGDDGALQLAEVTRLFLSIDKEGRDIIESKLVELYKTNKV